jgi:hypothetical protein
MEETPSAPFTWPLAVTLAALGGFVAAAGVFLGWWNAEAYRQSEIFGRQLVAQETLLGTASWTGMVALFTGIAVGLLGVAALLFTSDGVRRAAAILAMVGGLAILIVAGIGIAQASSVAEAEIGGTIVTVEGSAGFGLFLSAVGGLVALVAGIFARRTPLLESPASS